MQSRAWVWDGSIVPKMTTVTLPELGEHEVLVRVMAIGICATDLHIMNGEAQFASQPYSLGHEASGEVIRVGSRVRRVQLGDRCALDPCVGCGHCISCLSGNKHQCSNGYEHGINHSGFWQEYVILHENNLHVLPDHIGYDEASQCETIHVCVGGMDHLGIRPGETVLIIGDGPTGLFFAKLCKLQGAAHLTVVGSREKRLELARIFGADETVNYREDELLTPARERSFDVVIEAVGKKETIQSSQKFVANQGRILLFGLPKEKIELDVMDLILREIRMIGSANAPKVWPRVIELLDSGQIPVDPMITQRFKYEQLDEAIAFAFQHDPNTVKIVVNNE